LTLVTRSWIAFPNYSESNKSLPLCDLTINKYEKSSLLLYLIVLYVKNDLNNIDTIKSCVDFTWGYLSFNKSTFDLEILN